MRRIPVFAISLVCCSWAAVADEQFLDSFPLRHHSPFLQIFGLPAFRTAAVVSPGNYIIDMSFDVANDADDSESVTEKLIIDGESYTVALALRRRIFKRLELGIDVPYVRHTGGSLDSVIKDWHDVFGLSNARRDGPDDQLQYSFVSDEARLVNIDSSTSGIGDVQVSAAIPFDKFTVRTAVKLPTGDPDKLTGSGAADFSLGVYMSRVYPWRERLSLTGFAGVLALGDGDVLPELQRSVVPYGGLGMRLQATRNFGVAVQLSMQGSYFDTEFDDIGGDTFQLGFGADYRAGNFLWRLAFAEDVAAGAAPDFAMQLSVRYASAR